MEIYLDANATTPVLPQARAAAAAAMGSTFGNPSSVHSSGLRARALLDWVRATARRVIGASSGELIFTSGATEGIQTAVLSALCELRRKRDAGQLSQVHQVLYGATEHKAVSEALHYWNATLGLNLAVRPIPVAQDGRHHVEWLREQAPYAGLICTMAANNETGVISDLDAIESCLVDSPALWMVDSVQGLGKLELKLSQRRIDYAPFSGHKLYAPKGIGMLYVRDGAPFSPLQIGGGQERGYRSGTENMAGIAAMGAVLSMLERGEAFKDRATLAAFAEQIRRALRDAFPGVVFNAPVEHALPTTINFSVPGLSARQLLDLFDAAEVRVSGGSACSAAKALPSYVLTAMGLPEWQAACAVRLSFGAADDDSVIDEACARIRACGEALKRRCAQPTGPSTAQSLSHVTRFAANRFTSYIVADHGSRRCVVIDGEPDLVERLAEWVKCREYTLVAVLATARRHDTDRVRSAIRAAVPANLQESAAIDANGWPCGLSELRLGQLRLRGWAAAETAASSRAYVLVIEDQPTYVFVGDALVLDGRDPIEGKTSSATTLVALQDAVGLDTLLLPHPDPDATLATTLRTEAVRQPFVAGVLGLSTPAPTLTTTADKPGRASDNRPAVEVTWQQLDELLSAHPRAQLVDVREPLERSLSTLAGCPALSQSLNVPLSEVLNQLPQWRGMDGDAPIFFVCRSGNRSAQAAWALRRLGHPNAWSLAGGLALRGERAALSAPRAGQ